jgi:O-antigen biosynthesis protein WbqP
MAQKSLPRYDDNLMLGDMRQVYTRSRYFKRRAIKDDSNCQLEIPRAVAEKMGNHQEQLLIGESDVSDLRFVDVSKSGYQISKRAIDFFSSIVGILVLLIPMLLIALIVYIDDPGKVVFSQYRVGRYGKRFKLYKFRTMKVGTPKYLSTMEVENPGACITRAGHFLRKVSLDELLQLINVLKGDMSLVGPRPLISDEYEIHAMRMRFGAYNVRPGITGLAQINGRDTVSAVDKLHWDVRYLENFGFGLDAKILLATIPNTLLGLGVVEGTCNEKQGRKRANSA